MNQGSDKKIPVLILGGSENALSITRSLGRLGIPTYVSVSNGKNALYSKYTIQNFPYFNKKNVAEFWSELLLSGQNKFLHGSVILSCNDDAVEFFIKNREVLETKYILDHTNADIQLAMLDKKKTLQMARSLGISTPNFWDVDKPSDLDSLTNEIKFPVMIKPIHSHLFQKQFGGKKYFKANTSEELNMFFKQIFETELQVMVSEIIPGPDTLLGSFYTYLDTTGKPLFHYTKKIIRRYPKNEGRACYHKTEWDEEIANLGLKFFKGINYRGLGNIEFKRDMRDGQLKVIECNPRFTAAQELLLQSGMDIALLIYNHLTRQPLPHLNSYKQNLHYWYPVKDYRAYLELKRKKEITTWGWLKSLLHSQVFPYFQFSDPMPSIKPMAISLIQHVKKRIKV